RTKSSHRLCVVDVVCRSLLKSRGDAPPRAQVFGGLAARGTGLARIGGGDDHLARAMALYHDPGSLSPDLLANRPEQVRIHLDGHREIAEHDVSPRFTIIP